MSVCGRKLAEGQWFSFCGDTDMGQGCPAECTDCGGSFEVADPSEPKRHGTWHNGAVTWHDDDKWRELLKANAIVDIPVGR